MFQNVLRYFGFNHEANNENSIKITSEQISNLNVEQIENLRLNPNTIFELTNDAMDDAFHRNDIQKLKYLNKVFNLQLKSGGGYHIDISLEEGREEMTKFLIAEFGCVPSLYAKQMALVNRHIGLCMWVDEHLSSVDAENKNNNSNKRNDTGISKVHLKIKDKKLCWDDSIPEYARYTCNPNNSNELNGPNEPNKLNGPKDPKAKF